MQPTLFRHLRPHGGDTGIQNIINSCVTVQAPLSIMFTIRLVTFFVPAVLQAVPLQIFER